MSLNSKFVPDFFWKHTDSITQRLGAVILMKPEETASLSEDTFQRRRGVPHAHHTASMTAEKLDVLSCTSCLYIGEASQGCLSHSLRIYTSIYKAYLINNT